MLKPYSYARPASSVCQPYTPHLMTLRKEQGRNICMPQCPGHSLSSISHFTCRSKRYKQMGAMSEASPCHSLSLISPSLSLPLFLAHSKDLDGWRGKKETVTQRDRILLFMSIGSGGLLGKAQISFRSANRDKIKSPQPQTVPI